VRPARTASKRRLYSAEEIERLSLLRDATRAGHNIGTVAKWDTAELRKLAAENRPPPARNNISSSKPADSVLEEAFAAVKSLDAPRLEQSLKDGALQLGAQGLLQSIIAPLAHKIGEFWRGGEITAAHEHFATAVIRNFLGHSAKPFAGTENAPLLIAATPTGQLHELGALLAAALAVNLGWRVIYLGPSLPAAEIAGVAVQNQARAVALSLIYPEDDPRLENEFTRLRELLPKQIAIIAGGRVAHAYRKILEKIGALEMRDLTDLGRTLDSLRAQAVQV
jgi:methanogenic corrinoid protein MtbC1